MPGLDNRKIPDVVPFSFPRENGEAYRHTFELAMKSDPDWMLITSFNEWWENTHIEPSQTYGWQYIDLTTRYSSEFKGVTFLPSLQTSRTVTVRGQEGELNVVLTNNGNGSAIDLIAKDYAPTGMESVQSVDRLLPGDEVRYSVPFSILLGQVSLRLAPGAVTSKDVYGDPHSVQTIPVLQHYLAVFSPYGETSGTGWYDADSVAIFSISATSLPESGLMRIFGVKNTFDGWAGDSTATSPSATIIMDRPKTVAAVWRKDYTQLYVLATFLAVMVLFVIAIVAHKRIVRSRHLPRLETNNLAATRIRLSLSQSDSSNT